MKIFRTHCSLCVKAICTTLLSFLGFESSSEMRVMYGTPLRDFEIKGAVSVADSNEPVKNAQIKAKYDNEANQTVISIARTDSTGNFTLSGKAASSRLQIICTPADSILQPDTLSIPIQKSPNGYRGSAKKNIKFTLNRKK
ncbi:MAG: radical SAM-associated putative lipoprotein [Muribaculaceae bacterium]|nr:radical SAM-associated putative lipoprotein [Muribaculaceae bacterium]